MRTPHYHEGRPRCLSPLSFLPWFLLLLPGGRLRFLPQKVGGGKKKKKKKTPMLRARMGLSMYCMLRMVGHSFTTKCTYNIARAKKKKKTSLVEERQTKQENLLHKRVKTVFIGLGSRSIPLPHVHFGGGEAVPREGIYHKNARGYPTHLKISLAS